MRIAVIGPLEVQTEDAAPVTVPGAKERLLLAVLVAGAPGQVSTERLMECLWDGSRPASARKSLQAHVVRLRSSLEPDRPKGSTGRYVVRTGVGYALALDRRSIDALHVSDLAARGHALLASGNAAQAAHELDAAVGMWRGEPYADWPDAVFAEAERGRLCQIRAGAVAGLLDAQLQLGRHAEVLPELERLVAEDPLREDWWRLLMLALYRGGRQADALAAGRRARVLLTEELGADPARGGWGGAPLPRVVRGWRGGGRGGGGGGGRRLAAGGAGGGPGPGPRGKGDGLPPRGPRAGAAGGTRPAAAGRRPSSRGPG